MNTLSKVYSKLNSKTELATHKIELETIEEVWSYDKKAANFFESAKKSLQSAKMDYQKAQNLYSEMKKKAEDIIAKAEDIGAKDVVKRGKAAKSEANMMVKGLNTDLNNLKKFGI